MPHNQQCKAMNFNKNNKTTPQVREKKTRYSSHLIVSDLYGLINTCLAFQTRLFHLHWIMLFLFSVVGELDVGIPVGEGWAKGYNQAIMLVLK